MLDIHLDMVYIGNMMTNTETNIYDLYSNIPSDESCYEVNSSLWEYFYQVYQTRNGVRPMTDWSEVDVVMWIDHNLVLA
jgi:hypothetical protein